MAYTDSMLWATLAAAIATLIAALVALFLRELRAWIRPPKKIRTTAAELLRAHLVEAQHGGHVLERLRQVRHIVLRLQR